MPVEISNHGDLILVQLEGQLYVPDAEQFKVRLHYFVDKGIRKIHVNMSQLDFIDCAGLGVIVNLHNQLTNRGGRLTLTGMRDHVRELFQITSLTNVLNMEEVHVEKF